MAKLKSAAKKKSASATASHGSTKSVQAKAEGLSRSIMESAQQIWLAGMGAFGRAQQEGTKLFESLVAEGVSLEKMTRSLAGGKVDAVRGAVESHVGQVKERAADTWDRLEKVFEERVQRALNRLGVPNSEDLQALTRRVDQLNAELRKLGNHSTPKAAPSKASKPAKPAAVKPKAKSKKAEPAAPVQDATE